MEVGLTDALPLGLFAPLHDPDAVQLGVGDAFAFMDQEIVDDAPLVIDEGFTVIVKLGATEVGVDGDGDGVDGLGEGVEGDGDGVDGLGEGVEGDADGVDGDDDVDDPLFEEVPPVALFTASIARATAASTSTVPSIVD